MSQNNNTEKKIRRYILYAFISFLAIFLFAKCFSNSTESVSLLETDYSTFKEMIQNGSFSKVYFSADYLIGQINSPDENPAVGFQYTTPRLDDASLIPLLEERGIPFSIEETVSSSTGTWYLVLVALLPIIFFFIVHSMARKDQKGASKSPFKNMLEATPNKRIKAESDTGIRFKDIAGEDESKSELEEIVDYLKNTEKYRSMGARVPKGCLLVGPPGTGKTLLARAVAGEAGVPFFRVSGSDFVEMFVGVGASRVRELFAGAREKSPSIIFIDEIDAIGKVRGYSQMSGNDEREQTLNQLLVELDGFDSKEGVIVLAATNRAEILDPALMRAGRFDRQVYVDKPDLKGRLEILKIHTRKLKLGESVDLEKIARISGGLAGADLANIANEAALMAVRHSHERIEHTDFENAIEKSIAGLEKKSRVLSERERERIAYHETGHALTAFMTEGADPVSKISIIPRGSAALGYTMQLPREDRHLMSKNELIATIDVLLGGRAAEEVIYGEISTGASNDISRATVIAKDMIGVYGMSDKFMNVTLSKSSEQYYENFGPRCCSESTQEYIDNETARIIKSRYSLVKARLEEERPALMAIADSLMENEVLEENEFTRMALSLLNKSVS